VIGLVLVVMQVFWWIKGEYLVPFRTDVPNLFFSPLVFEPDEERTLWCKRRFWMTPNLFPFRKKGPHATEVVGEKKLVG